MIFDCDVIVGGYVGGFLSEFGAPLRELLAQHNTFEPDSGYLKCSRYKLESSALGAALCISRRLFNRCKHDFDREQAAVPDFFAQFCVCDIVQSSESPVKGLTFFFACANL